MHYDKKVANKCNIWSRIFNPLKLHNFFRKTGKGQLKSNFSRQILKLFPHYWSTLGIEHETFAYEPSAIQIRQQFVHETFLKLWFFFKGSILFIVKRDSLSYLFSQKDYATFKIDIFENMGVGVDNFKLCDILVGKPIEKRGNATKSSLLKHYIICRMKIPKISKRV